MSLTRDEASAANNPVRIRLGLIGDNIKRSRSPDLHRFAGRLSGLDVSYDLFIPRDMGKDFETVFDICRDSGLRGVNITYPYKEVVVAKVQIADPMIRRIGAVNTVVFENGGARGHNTDYTGFVAAYRQPFGDMAPGKVVMIGAGGVGRAVAFGLIALGAEELTIVDTNLGKAEALAAAVRDAGRGEIATAFDGDFQAVLPHADGVINCTPVGMVGYPGSPVPAELLGSQRWAFDAVYTPVETLFKQQAEAAGLLVLSGYELFFHQGIDAFRIFTGKLPADLGALRKLLLETIPN
jgi:shikimate dehydrogenase